jgi:hypothetical protein
MSKTFSSTFFVLSRFRVFLSDGGSKTHTKKRFAQKSRREVFTKKREKKTQKKTDCFSISLITFLGVSRRGEFKNTIKKSGKKTDQPWYF